MIQTAKKLVPEKEILSSSIVKPGKLLPPATIETVKQFYVSDELSKIMPETDDYVSVNSVGNMVHHHK
jgi:hypothetical protein